jgi:hypothetical protein
MREAGLLRQRGSGKRQEKLEREAKLEERIAPVL